MTLIGASQNEYAKQSLSNFDANRHLPRHRWLEFKEGFSADLVRLAVDDCSKTSPRLLDPFAGSGTTIVEAGRRGLNATGIEVNPFLHDVALAKCHHQLKSDSEVKSWRTTVLDGPCREALSPLEGLSTFTEGGDATKWIFNTSVLRGFEAISALLGGRTESWTLPMKVALLSALMETSNVRRDGKCVRYKKGWSTAGFTSADFRTSFAAVSKCVIDDLTLDSFTAKESRILNGDARRVLSEISSSSHDVVVTSPPYLNSFDYSDVYRPELFAGKYVSDNLQLRTIRHKTLRSHVQVDRTFAKTSTSYLLDPVLKELAGRKLWNRNIPGMISSYFWDMKGILSQLHRIVRRGGACWIVVSTSAYSGVQIPVDLILADVAGQCGWSLRGVYVLRNLRASGQHWAHLGENAKLPLRESLIVLDKRPR